MSSQDRRHGTSSSRARENVSLPPNGPFIVKKKKSRDRNRMMSDDEAPMPRSDNPHTHAKKKRHPIASASPGPSNSHVQSMSRMLAFVEPGVDRPHQPKSKMRHPPRQIPDVHPNSLEQIGHLPPRVKKESGQPRDRERRQRVFREATVPTGSEEEDEKPVYGGPGAAAEFSRLKKEVDSLKKALATSAKTADKQSKSISELKETLAAKSRSNKEQKSEIEKWKTKTQQSETMIANIEGTLQCQICIDTLSKPYALSPCGHILCQTCLQEWFRAAPAGDDMDLDEPLIYRKKTCPSCRARVRSRPLPLFLVKSLVSILERAKAAPGAPRPSPPPDTEDPWMDIFGSPRNDNVDDDDEDDDDLSEGDYMATFDIDDDDDDDEGLEDYDDTSDDEYEGEWVPATWEPPDHRSLTPLDDDRYYDNLFRRGVTLEMADLYAMEYTHEEGITAMVEDLCVHLGWNIDLAEDDYDGERFMNWCLEDMDRRPDRWMFRNGNVSMLVRADTVDVYESEESEVWIGVENNDDDEEDEE